VGVSETLRKRVRESWLPLLPPGWSFSRFEDALERVERPIELEDDVAYRQPVIRRNHGGVELRDTKLGRDILTKKQYLVRAGDWLMSKVQIMHRAYGIVPPELDGAIASGSYFTFVPRPNLHLPFLWYLSHLPAFHLTCDLSSVGVVIEKMVFRVDDWLGFEFPLPPLSEQQKIAAILSSVDNSMEGTQAVMDHLQIVKTAMAEELLRHGMPGRHTRFTHTAIGELPEMWDIRSIAELCRLTSGGTPRRDAPELWNGGIPWVKTGEINYGLIASTEETISAAALTRSSAKIVPKGTLLMAMYGQGATRGRIAMLGMDAAVNQACLAILQGEGISNHFLFHVLEARYPKLRSLGHEGTQKNLSATLVGEVLVPVPPRDEQNDIVRVLDSIKERSKAELDQLTWLRRVKAALMAVLLAGKVRVARDESEHAA
jgi:type I restriction enzyme S subunit